MNSIASLQDYFMPPRWQFHSVTLEPKTIESITFFNLFPYKKYPSERGFHRAKLFFSLIFYQYCILKKTEVNARSSIRSRMTSEGARMKNEWARNNGSYRVLRTLQDDIRLQPTAHCSWLTVQTSKARSAGLITQHLIAHRSQLFTFSPWCGRPGRRFEISRHTRQSS